MAAPRDPLVDPLAQGPLPPDAPRDPRSPGDLDPTERSQDPAREGLMGELASTPAGDLTDDEEEAAERDPGRQPRTFAPHAERAPKPPAPGDDRIVEQAIDSGAASAPVDPTHAGDPSDPAEMR